MSAARSLSYPIRAMSSLGLAPGIGGELVAGVPQVVQVEAIQADSGQGRQPHAAAEVRMSQW